MVASVIRAWGRSSFLLTFVPAFVVGSNVRPMIDFVFFVKGDVYIEVVDIVDVSCVFPMGVDGGSS